MVEQIYNKAPLDELETIDNHIMWIENVYNVIMNKKDEALTVEEVKEYIKNGLSTDDILIANRMSRKGITNINNILEEKQQGKSWYELIITDNETLSAHSDYTSLSGNDLLDAVIVSKNSGKSIESTLQDYTPSEDTTFISNFKHKKNIEAKQELFKMNLIPANFVE